MNQESMPRTTTKVRCATFRPSKSPTGIKMNTVGPRVFDPRGQHGSTEQPVIGPRAVLLQALLVEFVTCGIYHRC